MNLEAILSRLKGVRRNGTGWMALCPAHSDKNPSLSLIERNGKVFLKCFAGCSSEAVYTALGIELRELFPGNAAAPRIVAEYDYQDENGKLLFQVVRLEPKTFRQRQPEGNGAWRWNLNGTRRVLYRLQEVLTGKSVVVCEGEKDCETARELGILATCNAGGAGNWRDEYSESLLGKKVIIIADADEPGRKHAQQIASSLEGKAESLKLLELPGAKDLAEWVERGGTRDALLEMVRKAPEWRSSLQTTAGGFSLTSLRDLMSEPDEKISWIVADKLPAGGISILSAKPKVGKSTLARCLALAVARGEQFLGCPTTQGTVVYLALEEKRSEVQRAFSGFGCDR